MSLRVIAIAVASLALVLGGGPACSDTVLQFEGLHGLVDTYDELGFHFDGGEPCFFFCPAIPEGIAGEGTFIVNGGDPLGTTGFRDIDVTRTDGASFDLLSVDLVGFEDLFPNATDIGISTGISFFGHYQGGGGCFLGGVSNLAPPLIPSTLVFASCPGIDAVTAGGTGLKITTDNWRFRVVPEPASVVLLATGIAGLAARRRLRSRPDHRVHERAPDPTSSGHDVPVLEVSARGIMR